LWYIVVMSNTSLLEHMFETHIVRLQKAVAERPTDNPFDSELSRIDLKNNASLRELRVPLYNDHMDCLVGDQEYPMREFSDLVS
jgi:hypothetical protein